MVLPILFREWGEPTINHFSLEKWLMNQNRRQNPWYLKSLWGFEIPNKPPPLGGDNGNLDAVSVKITKPKAPQKFGRY